MKRVLRMTLLVLLVGFSGESQGAENPTPAAKVAEVRSKAEAGDAKAQFSLGVMYDKGRGVTKDEAEAVKWFRKAAERGHSPAQFNLGASYLFGQGVIKDPVQAHIWFNVAGAAGDEEARKQLRLLEKEMTPEQKAEATKLARELFERLPRKK